MRTPPPNISTPLCSCGCGQPTRWQAQQGHWATTIRGHARGPLSAAHKLAISHGHLRGAKAHREEPPVCGCGCGLQVAWSSALGAWSTFRVGHATAKHPVGSERGPAPLCGCNCGNPVVWNKGTGGWNTYVHGHGRKGRKSSPEHRKHQSEAARARSYLARAHGREVPVAVQSIYGTREYKDARARLVIGKPCRRCSRLDSICAHHERPGDNESLIPLCNSCHALVHIHEGRVRSVAHPLDHSAADLGVPSSRRFQADPPNGEVAPSCACGCGEAVRWARFKGWSTYRRGHQFRVPK